MFSDLEDHKLVLHQKNELYNANTAIYYIFHTTIQRTDLEIHIDLEPRVKIYMCKISSYEFRVK